jgi:hypothetical protein
MDPFPLFPLEIFTQFIDHLSDDNRALKRCSLVSKAWLHRARSHLFKEITLQHEKLELFISECMSSSLTGSSPPSTFHPVRHLTVEFLYPPSDVEDTVDGVDIHALSILKWIPHVTSLKLYGEDQQWIANGGPWAFPSSIVCLYLDMIEFRTTSDLVECVLLFPFLRRLSLGVSLDDRRVCPPPAKSQAILRALEYLHLHGPDVPTGFLHWLVCNSSPLSMQYLHAIGILYDTDLVELQLSLRWTASSLTELSVYLMDESWSFSRPFFLVAEQISRSRAIGHRSIIQHQPLHFLYWLRILW